MRKAQAAAAARRLAISAAWCALVLASLGAAAEAPPTRFEASRVVAFGDVHGAYDALVALLVQAGIIGEGDLAWRGGDTHLVSLGDLLDRGPDSRRVMDLLRRLQHEAAAAGGRVHVVLGNHELMNLTGDLRYVSAAEYAAFAPSDSNTPADTAEHGRPPGFAELTAAFAPDGEYGRWLLDQPALVVVNDSVFVHGGLSQLAAGYDPERLNALVAANLRELLALRAGLEESGVLAPHQEVTDAALGLRARLDQQSEAAIGEADRAAVSRFIELAADPLLAHDGPFWYRGNAGCHPLIEAPRLARVLEDWQVGRVVVGHTPTADSRIRSRLGGRVLLTDTGMLADYYRGLPSALILDDSGAQVIYAGKPGSVPPDEDTGALLHPLAEPEILSALANAPLTERPETDGAAGRPLALQGAADDLEVWFRPLPKRQIDAELAAFRLDRLLGLNLAVPVARRTVDGTDGIVSALWPGALTETERAERGLTPHNHCSPGATALLLLYAFDGLIQNQGRSTAGIHYDRRSWRLASSGHHDSFGRSRSLPAYLAGTPRVLPAGLAQALRRLDAATLETALGDTTNAAQRRALLARRDHLLANWTIGD